MKRNLNYLFILTAVIAISSLASADIITWTGAGDGLSLFQEANWLNEATGQAPPAGSVDGNKAINFDMVVNSGLVGGAGASNNAVLGSSLTMNGGTFKINTSTYGIKEGSLIINDGKVFAKYMVNVDVTMNGGSLTLTGGGNPINGSSIDINSPDATLILKDETPEAFAGEHLFKITLDGTEAVIGQNLSVVSDGGTGSIITSMVPEPATLSLLGLGMFGLIRRRK